jgi:hypothetical protein
MYSLIRSSMITLIFQRLALCHADGLLEPLLVGLEAPSAMPAREREALVVSAADDVLSTAAQLESFASLAPLLDRVDANKSTLPLTLHSIWFFE